MVFKKQNILSKLASKFKKKQPAGATKPEQKAQQSLVGRGKNQSRATPEDLAQQSLARPEDLAQQSLLGSPRVKGLSPNQKAARRNPPRAPITNISRGPGGGSSSSLSGGGGGGLASTPAGEELRRQIGELLGNNEPSPFDMLAITPVGATARVGGRIAGRVGAKIGKRISLEAVEQAIRSAAKGEGGKRGRAAAGQLIPPEKLAKLNEISRIAINTKTAKQTKSWLSRLVLEAKRKPLTATGIAVGVVGVSTFVVNTLMEAIGTYPFAGFIQQEATNSINHPIEQGFRDRNPERITKALDMKKEVIDPASTQGIANNIPHKNIMDKLDVFFKTETVITEIQDERLIELNNEIAQEEAIAAGLATSEVESFEDRQDRLAIERREREIKAREEDADFQDERVDERAEKRRKQQLKDEAAENKRFDERRQERIDEDIRLEKEKSERFSSRIAADRKARDKEIEEKKKSQLKFGLLG